MTTGHPRNSFFLAPHWGYWVAALVLVIAITIELSATVQDEVPWGGDEALYVMHARNLATGRPYADTGYIHNPRNPIHPAAAPPGMPALLAPAYRLAGLDWTLFKLVDVVFFGLFLLVFAALARQWLAPGVALISVAAVGLHPFMWELKETLPTEFPFMFFGYAALLLIDRCPPGRGRQAVMSTVAAAIAAACAYLTRNAGMVLFPAIALASIYQRRKLLSPGTLAAALGVALVLIAQHLYRTDVSTYVSYFDTFSLRSVLTNIQAYEIAYRFFLEDHLYWRSWGGHVLTCGVAAAIIIGFLLRARERLSVFELFLLGYIALLLIYPVSVEPDRYSMPVWPLLLLYGFVGCDMIGGLFGERWRHVPAAALCLVLAANFVMAYRDVERREDQISMTDPFSRLLFGQIRATLPASAVVIARKPTVIALFGERRASIWPKHADDAQFISYMNSIGARYIVQDLDKVTGQVPPDDELNTFVARNAGSLALLYSNPWFKLFKLEITPGKRSS